jgi:hypothetical protein
VDVTVAAEQAAVDGGGGGAVTELYACVGRARERARRFGTVRK